MGAKKLFFQNIMRPIEAISVGIVIGVAIAVGLSIGAPIPDIFAIVPFAVFFIPIVIGIVRRFGYVGQRACGCPETTPFGYEVVEVSTDWQREKHGSKVRWSKYQTELRRCEKCGSHYHASDNDPITQREAWPENEPEIMPSEEELFGNSENEETEIKSW